MSQRDDLVKIHGTGKCDICGKPKAEPHAGYSVCSYPHGMVPDQQVQGEMMTWKRPEKG